MPNQNIFEHKDLTLTRDFIQKLNALEQGMVLGNVLYVVTGSLLSIDDAPTVVSTSGNYQTISEKIGNNVPVIVKLCIGHGHDYVILHYAGITDGSVTFESGIYDGDITSNGFKKCVIRMVFIQNDQSTQRTGGYVTVNPIDEIENFECEITNSGSNYYVATLASLSAIEDALDNNKSVVFSADFPGNESLSLCYSGLDDNEEHVFSNMMLDVAQGVLRVVRLCFPSVGNCYVTVSEYYLSDSSVQSSIEKTYAELAALASGSQLVPNQTYVITDFQTTSSETTTSSVTGTVMQLQVKAATDSELFPEAKIISSQNDTLGSNVTKWKVLYDLNNDTDKYSWADTTNGKGVIYHLEDERGNRCDYDFKNIKFKHSDTEYADSFFHTFTYSDGDATLSSDTCCDNNIIKSKRDASNRLTLPNIIIMLTSDNTSEDGYVCNNTFEYCNDIMVEGSFVGNYMSKCSNVTFDDGSFKRNILYNVVNTSSQMGFEDNTIYGCSNTTFGIFFQKNTVGHGFSGNSIGNMVKSNTFGENCTSMTVGNQYESCVFGNGTTGVFTSNSGGKVKNIHVMSGFSGTFDGNLYDGYNPSLFISRTSRGVVKAYSIADLVK